MYRFLARYPLYLILLPVFFVLHGFVENLGFIEIKEAVILLFSYFVLTGSIALYSYFFFRNWNRSCLITTLWMSFFFFFGAIHEFMKEHSPIRFFTRYSFLLTGAIILMIALFIYFKKSTKPFQRFSIYLNVLLLVYIGVDAGTWLWKKNRNDDRRLSVYKFAKEQELPFCDTCTKPDIFFLLFDEYSNPGSLLEQYGYHNPIDSLLTARGFHFQSHSRSNYNFTAFSMSSILNMTYIDGLKDPRAVTAEDYANCNILIRDNRLIRFLDQQGYEIVNYSVFDLAGNPSMVDQSFLPLKTKLISDRTLFSRLNKDIGWLLMTRWPFNMLESNSIRRHRLNNELFAKKVKEEAARKSDKPRFVYGHFYMPHAPFFYNSKNELKDESTIYNEFVNPKAPYYLDYIPHSNKELLSIVDTIRAKSPNAAIIIMSDHGFREKDGKNYPQFFRNLNAVYFPDGDYRGLYDSISAVNQFRVILNKYYPGSFQTVADSTVLLIDKK